MLSLHANYIANYNYLTDISINLDKCVLQILDNISSIQIKSKEENFYNKFFNISDVKLLLNYINFNLLSKYQKAAIFITLVDFSINNELIINKDNENNIAIDDINNNKEIIKNNHITDKIVNYLNSINCHISNDIIINLWKNYFNNIENDKFLSMDHNSLENSYGIPMYKILLSIMSLLFLISDLLRFFIFSSNLLMIISSSLALPQVPLICTKRESS